MIQFTQSTNHTSKQYDTTRKIPIEKLFRFCVLLLAFALISCSKTQSIEPEIELEKDKNWNAVDIGQISTDRVSGQIIIAGLRGDGISRLYILAGNPFGSIGIQEFSYSNNSWTKTRIDKGISGFNSIAIGRCKNDGILRLYGVSSNKVCEFDFANNQWTIQDIYSLGGGYLVIGDPKNDGFESLYISGAGGIYEISFRSGIWVKTLVVTEYNNLSDICVGNGRGDGKDRIYISYFTTEISEISFENGSWKKSSLGQLISLPENVVAWSVVEITNTHNGRPAVFAGDGGNLYEFYFTNDQWTKVMVGSEPGINQICGGIGRNDGINRLYWSAHFDRLAEYTFVNDSWIKSSQMTTDGSTSLNGLTVGPGRGDGTNRIYVLQFIGHLYEFTYNQ